MANEETRDQILKEAFGHHRALKAYARGLIPDPALAEDAVQNTYLTVTRKYGDFQLGTSVLAWCRAIVRFEVLQILRSREREISTEDRLLFDAISEAFEQFQTPDREVIRNEQAARLEKCFGRLPERSKTLIQTRYSEDLGLSSIASRMTMSSTAVRKSIYRIRLLLRKCLEHELTAG